MKIYNNQGVPKIDGAISVPDGDKGDITVSSSGNVWTIDAGVVSTSKMGGDVTAAGKALLDDADASAQRTTIGLGMLSASGNRLVVTGGSEVYGIGLRYNSGTGQFFIGATNSATPDFVASNSAGSSVFTAKNDRTFQLNAYGAGILKTDSSGNLSANADTAFKSVNIVILASGTTYTPTANTESFIAYLIGGGGGSGACSGAGSSVGVSGGGGSGAIAVLRVNSVSGTYSYTIGAAGAAGATPSGNGGNGGDTTFTVSATTTTAPGGSGSLGATAGTAVEINAGGAAGGTSTNATASNYGTNGGHAIRLSGTVGISGDGGSNLFGVGGIGRTSGGVGNVGIGFGSGGGGSFSNGATDRAGRAGRQGAIIIYEFIK